jgi:hypothetical protein
MKMTKTIQSRALIMEKLEVMLAQWMEHKYQHAIPLSMVSIQAEAKILFNELNAIDADQKVPLFAASAGWFECFKGLHCDPQSLRSESCQSTDL